MPPAVTGDRPSKRREPRRRRIAGIALPAIAGGLIAATVLATANTVAGYRSGWWWPLLLLEHLRIQLLWLLLLMVAGLWLIRRRWWAVGALGALLLNLIVLGPYWFGGGSSSETTLTLLHLNTDRGRRSTLAYLEDRTEDVVFLQEVTPDFANLLDELDEYQLVIARPRDDTRGSAMLVRRDWAGEVVTSEVMHIPDSAERPLLSADLMVGDRLVTVISYHAIRPGGSTRTRYHSNELNHLASWVEAHDGEVIVIGDFNATPWSNPIRGLEAAGLVLSNRGHGLQGTWPADQPGVLRIPIDLCLHTTGWETVAYSIGPAIGGDHRPLHVGLGHRPIP